MRETLIAASLIALAALPAAARAQDYRAAGTEPFWSLAIGPKIMRFEAPGHRPVSVPTPRVIHGFAGEMWQTRRIDVNTIHRPCSDGMSGRGYSDTVTVQVDGHSYRGCGGAMEPSAPGRPAVEGSWRIEALNGRPVARGTAPTVRFGNGRVSGNAGCNSFGGSFSLARGRLTAGPLTSTRMACAERARNAQEATILGMLAKPLSVSRNRAGKLVLTGAQGHMMTLTPVGPG